jgi:hypothetical protein
MPHCRNCGNPVSRADRECNICGSKLFGGKNVRKPEEGHEARAPNGPAYIGNPRGQYPSTGSPPLSSYQESPSRVWSPGKVFAVIVTLALLMPLFAYLLSVAFSSPITQPTTPTGGFISVTHEDNLTVLATFDDFYPETRYEECDFTLTIGWWTSSKEEVAGGQVYYVSSPDDGVWIHFIDQGMNGVIEAGDYCTIQSSNIPVSTPCILTIYYRATGENICHAWFSFY